MSGLSERVAREHFNHGWERCRCGADIATRDRHVTIGDFARHVAEVTEAAVRETIAAATPNQEWGWGTNGWKPGDPDDFLQPMTAGHNVFTEADVRHNVERFGGIAVVRTIYTAPEPGPWKDADA